MNVISAPSLSFNANQLSIIRNTVAKDTTTDEFNLFIEQCRMYGLNPMKREISAQVYSPEKPKYRKMVVVVEIGGQRVLAARSGDYRPDDEEPRFTYNEALKHPETNPLGIEKCVVRCYKRDPQGQWFPVVGVAYWDEFAPVEKEWSWHPEKRGEKVFSGKSTLGGMYGKMPRHMLSIRAENIALKKGWPETMNGIYADGDSYDAEFNVLTSDPNASASDLVEEAETEVRNARIGRAKDEFPLVFQMGGAVEMITADKVFARAEEYLQLCETSMEIMDFYSRNSEPLKRFWADHKNDALELKRIKEHRLKALVDEAEKAHAAAQAEAEAAGFQDAEHAKAETQIDGGLFPT